MFQIIRFLINIQCSKNGVSNCQQLNNEWSQFDYIFIVRNKTIWKKKWLLHGVPWLMLDSRNVHYNPMYDKYCTFLRMWASFGYLQQTFIYWSQTHPMTRLKRRSTNIREIKVRTLLEPKKLKNREMVDYMVLRCCMQISSLEHGACYTYIIYHSIFSNQPQWIQLSL